MTKLNVITAPDPILKTKALAVEIVDDGIRKILDDMLETMYADDGVGLAANQVGILKRLLVIDLQNDDDKNRGKEFYPLYLVNPEIKETSADSVTAKEYCMSVPEEGVPVARPSWVKVSYLDYHGNQKEIETDGWLARAIQHEMDHLNGKVILDYLSSIRKDIVLRKLTKLKRISA